MKGICFIEQLTLATVEGYKTQTRRLGKPRFKIGEVVYLKEPYAIVENGSRFARDGVPVGAPLYKYNYPHCAIKWKNKLFMPAEVARYFIRITAVRPERLQNISDNDCMREGIIASKDPIGMPDGYNWVPYSNYQYLTPRLAYAALIDKINGRGTWGSNPWVWVYDYELIEKPTQNGQTRP